MIFVNLPVKDLAKAKAFFEALGFSFEPKFTNASAACMVVGVNMYVMLLVEEFFRTFTDKTICDATTHAETLICLSLESRAKLDELVAKAVAAGGTAPRKPQEQAFMYGHGFQDLDGHNWELIHMATDGAATG